MPLRRMCEEVQKPATQVPRAMVATVCLNTLCGLLFMIPLIFVLPDIQELLALVSAQPVPTILKSAVGSSGGAFGLLFPLMVLALMCGIGCTTATSRCIFAFARDGAVPGAKWWMKVNRKLDVPLNAMMLSMVCQLALGLIYFGSTAAFNAFSGVGVISLTVSYAVPIAISLMTGRKQVKTGQFYLGAIGTFSNYVSIGAYSSPNRLKSFCLLFFFLAWSLLVVPLFCMPSAIPVTAETVNYAPVVFVFATGVSAIWYWVWGHKNYAGPPTHDD
jgi:amino acid transporter